MKVGLIFISHSMMACLKCTAKDRMDHVKGQVKDMC